MATDVELDSDLIRTIILKLCSFRNPEEKYLCSLDNVEKEQYCFNAGKLIDEGFAYGNKVKDYQIINPPHPLAVKLDFLLPLGEHLAALIADDLAWEEIKGHLAVSGKPLSIKLIWETAMTICG